MNTLSISMVIIFGIIGGKLVDHLQANFIKSHFPAVTIPGLVGMILFGCIARNTFGHITEEYYPMVWADWIR